MFTLFNIIDKIILNNKMKFRGKTMRKVFAFVLTVFCSFMFTGCLIEPDSSSAASAEQFQSVLQRYRTATTLTVIEETEGKLTGGQSLSAVRTTNVDRASSYCYSKIACGNKQGYVFQDGNTFYTSYEGKRDKTAYSDTDDIYRSLGFSSLFSVQNFTIQNSTAKKNISAPDISGYTVLFDNVNFDLGTDYTYNPSVLKVLIEIENNRIASLQFDLSLVFGSYFTELKRTVTFSEETFDRESIETANPAEDTDYSVETGNTLETYVVEMIQEYGDAIYIKTGNFDMLIDAGQYQDGPNVRKILETYCTDNTLEVLIGTHGHADHLAGFGNGALDSINNVNLIIDFGYTDNNCADYKEVRDSFIAKGAEYYSAYECVRYQNGASKKYNFSEDLSLEVLDTGQYAQPNQRLTSAEYGAENDFSVVVKLTFKENTYLYTGDLAGELGGNFTTALKQEDIANMTVYKAAHHGASTYGSNNTEFINYINPQICVSSAAIIDSDYPYDHTVNSQITYQHPRPAFVRWILNTPTIKTTKQYYFNGTMGTIRLTDDGVHLPAVEGLGATKGYSVNGSRITGEQNKKFTDTRMYQSFYLS